ncbi:bactofilin family protein [Paenibacillus gansuensis]|uniref:Polymer-forming cytoskeletal protein n=1 Tax=Paenibacillus gansuensis TaxID=306542 RepID=A0ABW5PEU4_9BACL
MFGRKKTNRQANLFRTFIGEGCMIEGKLICETGLRVEGEVTGDIESAGDVVIGSKGTVRSDITARDVHIVGKVYGNVTAKGRLTLSKNGMLQGDLRAGTLVIEEGAIFMGSSLMEKPETGKPVKELPLPEKKGKSQRTQAAG